MAGLVGVVILPGVPAFSVVVSGLGRRVGGVRRPVVERERW
jgi:hypothetical protein